MHYQLGDLLGPAVRWLDLVGAVCPRATVTDPSSRGSVAALARLSLMLSDVPAWAGSVDVNALISRMEPSSPL
jgi:hypothetical protein